MLILEIPGRDRIQIEHIAFDFNGTLATDGSLSEPTRQSLRRLLSIAQIHVLTADTYGTAYQECAGIGVSVDTFPGQRGGEGKARVVCGYGPSQTLCVGNGCSDIPMAKICAVSIGVIGLEGASGALLHTCDIVVTSIEEVFDLLHNPQRIVATLRS